MTPKLLSYSAAVTDRPPFRTAETTNFDQWDLVWSADRPPPAIWVVRRLLPLADRDAMRYLLALALLLLCSCGDEIVSTMTEQERLDEEWRSELEVMPSRALALMASRVEMDLRHSLERIKHDLRWWIVMDVGSKESAGELARALIESERKRALRRLDILRDVRAKHNEWVAQDPKRRAGTTELKEGVQALLRGE